MNEELIDSRLYNKEFKSQFLEAHSKNYVYLFRNTRKTEKEKGKDLYDFSLEEIGELFQSFKLKTRNGLQNLYTIRNYIEFAIKKEQKTKNGNPLRDVDIAEWGIQFIDVTSFMSESQIMKIISECKNAQDQALIRLLFEGAFGHKLSELSNLKKEDVDIERKIVYLTDSNNKGSRKRALEVSDICIQFLQEAMIQENYLSQNGTSTKIYVLNDTIYVFRDALGSRINKQQPDKKLESHVIRNRLETIEKTRNLPSYFRRPSYIQQSGIIYFTKQHYEEIGEIDEEFALNKLYERFNKKQVVNKIGGKEYPSFAIHHRFLVQQTNIEDVYGKMNFPDFKPLPDQNKEKRLSKTVKRDQQSLFHKRIKKNYNNRCAISGEETDGVLQAAHIQGYINEKSNHNQNGILLRVDFHQLFDKYLLTIDENYCVLINNKVNSIYYRQYHGKEIELPDEKSNYPSQRTLKEHRKIFFKSNIPNNLS